MKKALIVATLTLSIAFAPITEAKAIKTVVIPEKKLTYSMLTHRKQKRIQYIEVEKGTVINAKKRTGKTTCGHIVSYKSVPGKLHKGDKVTMYLVWNPDTNYTDDVIASWCSVDCNH